MDKEAIPRRSAAVLALAGALAVALLALAAVVASPKAASAAPPDDADQTFTAEGFCEFPVLVQITGKMKVIDLPGRDFMVTSPGQHATLTNVEEPANRLRVNTSGPGRVTPLDNGDVRVVARGHNLLYDPGEGIFLTVGKVRFTVASGPGVGGDITILESRGRLIDLCARLA